MELKVLGSSSSGNCYILEAETEALILEAGIKVADVKKALGFNIRKAVGCLITHQHNDHAKYIKAMLDLGIKVLALPDVWVAKEVWEYNSVAITPSKGYKLGGFKVVPFHASHDVPCCGYLIEHQECGRIMFLTDSYRCRYTFPKLNHILIECNYSHAELERAIREGRTMESQRERLMLSHMELSECARFLNRADLSRVREIILIHLSDNNSNKAQFAGTIERETGKVTHIAKPGMKLDLYG